ncbi:MAG: AmmeMemoRadiSam system radical SAM enzyme [Promethearchaeia archaeon]
MIKKAKLWESLEDKKVECHVCANECIITPGNVGICGTRKNIDGEIFSLTYGSMISKGSIDPIEKKPLYHFYPGTSVYSIASIGCSFRCKNCQNWRISQATPSEDGSSGTIDFENYRGGEMDLVEMSPEELVEKVKKSGARSVAYTYNEPLIWHEWIIDTAELLKKEGITTVLVTNGYSTPEASEELINVGIDAANIDIKSMQDEFYKEICGVPTLKPVLETAKRFKNNGIHVEITNLIIPDKNDSDEELKQLCEWIYENLGANTPLHFSAYRPMYKKPSKQSTPKKLLVNAYDIAKNVGLKYPYIGNVRDRRGSNTFCPKCGMVLIERSGFSVSLKGIENGNCAECGYDLKQDLKGLEVN